MDNSNSPVLCTVKARMIYKNLEIQNAIDKETGLIISQEKLKDIKFGFYNISYSGCGVIAAYNMLVLKGENPHFITIKKFFEKKALFGTLIGTYKSLMLKFLKSEKIKVIVINNSELAKEYTKNKIGSVLFFNGKGFHWSAFKNVNDKITFYNLYNNEGITNYSDVNEFILQNVKFNQVVFLTI